jgi:hypothetical protein
MEQEIMLDHLESTLHHCIVKHTDARQKGEWRPIQSATTWE